MANLSGQERARYVQGMFERIAPRYDLMNRLITAGLDVHWRRELIRRAALPSGGRLLDLGAGTGDLAYEASRQFPGEVIIAAYYTLEMMRIGKERSNLRTPTSLGRLSWCAADALECLNVWGRSRITIQDVRDDLNGLNDWNGLNPTREESDDE